MNMPQETRQTARQEARSGPAEAFQATGALAEALELAGGLVARVAPDQWSLPTPCTEWDVRQLVDHLVAGNQLFARVLSGEPFDQAVPAVQGVADRLGDDPAAAFRASARDLIAAFAAPGVLERPVRVPFGTVPGAIALHLRVTECLVHGWDLATATGVPFDPPAQLVEQELAFSTPLLSRVPPERRVFAPSRPAGENARPIERLVALLGREPVGV